MVRVSRLPAETAHLDFVARMPRSCVLARHECPAKRINHVAEIWIQMLYTINSEDFKMLRQLRLLKCDVNFSI